MTPSATRWQLLSHVLASAELFLALAQAVYIRLAVQRAEGILFQSSASHEQVNATMEISRVISD